MKLTLRHWSAILHEIGDRPLTHYALSSSREHILIISTDRKNRRKMLPDRNLQFIPLPDLQQTVLARTKQKLPLIKKRPYWIQMRA